MSVGDITLTVVGNLTGDPELKFTNSGTQVAAFTVAASRRVYDQQAGQWKDADTVFLRCSVWRQLAEHVCDSLTKGTRVIVTGRLKQRQYETAEKEKRTVYEVEVEVDEIGPSMRYATAKITKVSREHAPGQTGPAGADDPWVNATSATTAPGGDQPPF